MSTLLVRVERPDETRFWLKISPKIFNAIVTEKKLNKIPLWKVSQTLIGAYINIPLIPYHRNKSVIGIAKIKRFKWVKDFKSDMLCTRSQFVTQDNLEKHFFKSYRYLKHDYSHYSRLNIFINLLDFKRRSSNH